jgi:hypothetical protein
MQLLLTAITVETKRQADIFTFLGDKSDICTKE